MGSPTATAISSPCRPSFPLNPLSSQSFWRTPQPRFTPHLHIRLRLTPVPSILFNSISSKTTRATTDDAIQDTNSPLLVQDQDQQSNNQMEVEKCVRVLKNAAKTRRVAADDVLSALFIIEKAKLDPSRFLETLGGSKSPGRTWMLIFTAQNRLKSGRYFPLTAVQRFDAAAKRIENGLYLGPLGWLTFEGRFSWKKRILSFIFECIRVKIGPFNPLEIQFGGKDEREPSTKDPFFIWFYIDEEIAVARGRSGGTAFWCRCRRVSAY
ncbi:hypothetical protein NMG60_11024104 [Bertholletia excelsa]